MTTHHDTPTSSSPRAASTPPMAAPIATDDENDPQHLTRILRALDRRSYAVLSTVSAAGHPHAAGIAYDNDGTTMYVHTMASSRKARNVAATGRAAVVVPVRRIPIGPPFAIQFQATARLLTMDDPTIVALIERGRLGTTTKHDALQEPDGCFLELAPTGRIHTYGLGVPILAVARDPLHVGARSVAVGGA